MVVSYRNTLARRRIEAGIRSASALAAAIEVHPNTVARWERTGALIPIARALRLCEVLGISLDALFEANGVKIK